MAMIPAVQNQLNNEFNAKWGQTTTLQFGATLDPAKNYYVIFTDAVDKAGAYGYHWFSPCPACDPAGNTYNQPNSKVWAKVFPPVANGNLQLISQTFSHECCEFLADPVLQSYTPMLTINGVKGQFIKEVCDPITGGTYGGGNLENFVFPNWYVPGSTGPWDQLGMCTAALQTIGQGFASFLTDKGVFLRYSNGNFTTFSLTGMALDPAIHQVNDDDEATILRGQK